MRRPHRSAVLASSALFCAVCESTERIIAVRVAGQPRPRVIRCPHCCNGNTPIPILTLPMRRDVPRGAA